MNKKSENWIRAAGLMGIATLLSRVLGLVREQVFAILFGAGNFTDAFNVAFRIPNLLRDLFAEGAMSASLVPTFTQARHEQGDRGAWRVAGLVFRVLAATAVILSLLGILFAPQLVGLYAAAFREIPGKLELTIRMTRMMYPFFPFVALAAAFMGVLNACGVFFLPSFSSALFNLTSIVVGVVLAKTADSFGIHPIEGMAIGVVVGGAVQALCQLPSLYRVGYRWAKRSPGDPVWFRDPYLRRMLFLMIPGTWGLAATQVNVLVNTVLATSQGPGAVSWLNYAFRLMQFPIGVFGVSLAQATLPRVSKFWVEKDYSGVEQSLTESLRHVFAINLPASAGLAFLGVPLINMIFQYGRFTSEDSRATALALVMYSVGLTAYSAVKVLVPVFYAMGNTRIPVLSSALAVAVTIVLNLLMVRPFGYWGLALGTSVAAIFNAVYLLYSARRLLRQVGAGWNLSPVFSSFMKNAAVALMMGGVVYGTNAALNWLIPDLLGLQWGGKPGLVMVRVIKVLAVVLEGVGVAAALGQAFGITETLNMIRFVRKKLKMS